MQNQDMAKTISTDMKRHPEKHNPSDGDPVI
jgi:hypothetical protein